ncbi:hypothetical protein ABID12_003086 [Martelella mangrovi]|uniref:Uncharacterized protein n=1 Tax=Martelella mangrovi TaxID=1397477 RepID=A0ABV2IDZ1_9HYPH
MESPKVITKFFRGQYKFPLNFTLVIGEERSTGAYQYPFRWFAVGSTPHPFIAHTRFAFLEVYGRTFGMEWQWPRFSTEKTRRLRK